MENNDRESVRLARIMANPRWAGVQSESAHRALAEGALTLRDVRAADRLLAEFEIAQSEEVTAEQIGRLLLAGRSLAVASQACSAFAILSPGSSIFPALRKAIYEMGGARGSGTSVSVDLGPVESILRHPRWSKSGTEIRGAILIGRISTGNVQAMDCYLAYAEQENVPPMSTSSFLGFVRSEKSAALLRDLAPLAPLIWPNPEARSALDAAIRHKTQEFRSKSRGRDSRSVRQIMDNPRWKGIDSAKIEGLISDHTLNLSAFRLLDCFLSFLEDHGAVAADADITLIPNFLSSIEGDDLRALNRLRNAIFRVFQGHPILRAIDRARSRLTSHTAANRGQPDARAHRARRFSIPEFWLPIPWQEALAGMRAGLAGLGAPAPAPAVTITLVRKVCEFAKSARDSGLEMVVSIETATVYERSLLERKRPLSPSTIHSSLTHILHFVRYIEGESSATEHLLRRVRVHDARARKSMPQKAHLAAGLPTYAEILEVALGMLQKAELEPHPRNAQKFRNYAAAIALMCPFPLRVSDSVLRFGDNLTWSGESYHLLVPATSKTGRPYQAVIHPFFGVFIDALILQGASSEFLDQLRDRCIQSRRLLFVKYDDSAPHPNFVSYVWHRVMGTGSHIARTKIHDELAALGPRGVDLALMACSHRSSMVAEHYRTQMFQIRAGDHVHLVLERGLSDAEWDAYFG